MYDWVVSIFRQQSKMLIDSLRKQEKNNRNGTNLQQVISRLTLNIICGTKKKLILVEAFCTYSVFFDCVYKSNSKAKTKLFAGGR